MSVSTTNLTTKNQKIFEKFCFLDHVWLEITQKCNLTCDHCYAESGPSLPLSKRMEREDWLDIMEELADLGCESVQFIGGEPTLHPFLDTLLQKASFLGFKEIEVFTNGTTLTSQRVKKYNDWGVDVALSFYSTKPEKHNALTNQEGSYQKTVRGLKRALNGNLQVRVEIIQIDQPDSHIKEVRKFLTDIGVENIGIDRVRNFGRANEKDLVSLKSPKEKMGELCGQCYRGRLCITSSGDVFPCIMSREEFLGNVFQENIENILTGKRRKDFVERQIEYLGGVQGRESCRPEGKPCSPGCGPDECGPYFDD